MRAKVLEAQQAKMAKEYPPQSVLSSLILLRGGQFPTPLPRTVPIK